MKMHTQPDQPLACTAREATETSTHLCVIQVRMISAVRADDLIPVGVAAFERAIYDADRLTAQDRLVAVAGSAGER